MDVDSFIRAHEDEWKRLEVACRGGAEALAKRPGGEISETIGAYLRASTHLAEARSRYADPRLERYLNDLVGQARASIYAARTGTLRGFVRFFGVRYREAIRQTAPFILVAAGLMVIVVVASWAWVAHSPEARLGLFPPAARSAIQRFNGDRTPGLGPSQALATRILFNNVQVAFLAFAFGITLGIGTIYLLLQNSLLLGLLAGAFGSAGRGPEFWGLILPHGLLELTAICIAAGAGLRMGWAIVDPGDRSRRDALSQESTSAVIVVLGVVPAFVLAAAIEGFNSGSVVTPRVQVAIGVVVWVTYHCFL
ncbi:MAG: hypothetical protein QOG88_1551, partial [Actinomycetota bacterium]|nr:hypothetical protein [Actinomycetota bacterium]